MFTCLNLKRKRYTRRLSSVFRPNQTQRHAAETPLMALPGEQLLTVPHPISASIAEDSLGPTIPTQPIASALELPVINSVALLAENRTQLHTRPLHIFPPIATATSSFALDDAPHEQVAITHYPSENPVTDLAHNNTGAESQLISQSSHISLTTTPTRATLDAPDAAIRPESFALIAPKDVGEEPFAKSGAATADAKLLPLHPESQGLAALPMVSVPTVTAASSITTQLGDTDTVKFAEAVARARQTLDEKDTSTLAKIEDVPPITSGSVDASAEK
ncbi:hypothetical protein HWV62_4890, partial [Athelia sp. TMB]